MLYNEEIILDCLDKSSGITKVLKYRRERKGESKYWDEKIIQLTFVSFIGGKKGNRAITSLVALKGRKKKDENNLT